MFDVQRFPEFSYFDLTIIYGGFLFHLLFTQGKRSHGSSNAYNLGGIEFF